jgi:hypothetical protein
MKNHFSERNKKRISYSECISFLSHRHLKRSIDVGVCRTATGEARPETVVREKKKVSPAYTPAHAMSHVEKEKKSFMVVKRGLHRALNGQNRMEQKKVERAGLEARANEVIGRLIDAVEHNCCLLVDTFKPQNG